MSHMLQCSHPCTLDNLLEFKDTGQACTAMEEDSLMTQYDDDWLALIVPTLPTSNSHKL